MDKLLEKLNEASAFIKPATESQIKEAEKILNLQFSSEYTLFLSLIGSISYDGEEIYGLGTPVDYYLNLLNIVPYLREINKNLPLHIVPINNIGDGCYYVYDNNSKDIYIWTISDDELLEKVDSTLENILMKILFNV